MNRYEFGERAVPWWSWPLQIVAGVLAIAYLVLSAGMLLLWSGALFIRRGYWQSPFDGD